MTPSEKLAHSLEALRELQNEDGTATIRAKDLSRTHRERLLQHGFIQEVIKGWYISSKPDESPGDSTAWYTSFWTFCSDYLHNRFSKEWCLSPEQSLSIHSGNWTVPQQLLVRSPKGHNNLTNLPYGTSLFDAKLSIPNKKEIVESQGLKLYSLPMALITSSESYFSKNSTDVRTSLTLIKDASDILNPLLEGGHTRAAGRLAGSFRNIGNTKIADEINKTMIAAGYNVRESDPFNNTLAFNTNTREKSPYAQRIKLMWQQMRETVLEDFPATPGIPEDVSSYIKQVEDIYTTDAYHSLSIEGYRVSIELIDRVRSGDWNPESNHKDKELRNAMAARGYWQAFQVVKQSIEKVLSGQNAGNIVDQDHSDWYRELFGPSVTAGLLKPSDLAGYRNGQVYITNSMHVPLNRDAVRDCMPVLFDLLAKETEPSVRAVLGHFIFVYIHPYMDGNGRIGRFLFNTMLASGGYPWTIIPVESRDTYMNALEQASVTQDIKPFAKFLASLVDKQL